ncbi:MAG: carbohydrate porin [Lautropia sp.]|nr:carbohydrate porin [Lautropia sp.]
MDNKKSLALAGAGALFAATCLTTPAVAQEANPFTFGAYFRSGAGTTSEEGGIACVRLPGSITFFRLGNECDTYVELRFGSKLGEVKGTTFDAKFTFSHGTQGLANWEQSAPALREAFVTADNIGAALGMKSLEGANLWVGKRFYKNPDIHMLDYAYWEPGMGPGFGIDNVAMGPGRFAYAMFRIGDMTGYGINPSLGGYNPDLIGGGSRSATVHDFRLEKIGVNPGGSLTVGFDLIRANNRGGTSTYTVDTPQSLDLDNNPATPNVEVLVRETRTIDNKPGKNGAAFTVSHEQENFLGVGGTNTLGLQFAKNAASLKGFGFAGSTDERKEWLVFDHWLYQPAGSRWSATSTVGYRNSDINDVGVKELWLGTRPHYSLNEVLGLYGELGYQQLKQESQATRKLTKLTLGTQFAMGEGVFARPALRLYATYAKWNDAAASAGSVVCTGRDCATPVSAFADKRSAMFYGVQVEAWF